MNGIVGTDRQGGASSNAGRFITSDQTLPRRLRVGEGCLLAGSECARTKIDDNVKHR